MKPVCIIKLGSTMPELKVRRGDFEDWIAAGLGLPAKNVVVTDVRTGSPLPDEDGIGGVVITGSEAMVTERHDWSHQTAAWLLSLFERCLPILGICFGHQLLAKTTGGRVDNNPYGREIGTVEVTFTSAARDDALLGGLANPSRQSVVKLPRHARCLATSAMDPHQAFVVGERAWGVQFHPEFDLDIMRTYIKHRANQLSAEGNDPERPLASCVEAPAGRTVLRRFGQITRKLAS